MARRRMTVKRIDPWSVLKFSSLANVAFLAIFLLVMAVVWFIIDRLQVVEQICGIAMDVGFTQCGVNAGNLFRALMLLGLLWVVVQTAVMVFMAFLHNLIADLTGGLVVTVVDESAPGVPVAARSSSTVSSGAYAGSSGTGQESAVGRSGGDTASHARARPADTGPRRSARAGVDDDALFGDR